MESAEDYDDWSGSRRGARRAEPDLSAAALLRQLDREPNGPPAIDVGRAIATGRRHRFRMTMAGSLAAVAATGLVVGAGAAVARHDRQAPKPLVAGAQAGSPGPGTPAAPPVPTSCSVARLPLPAGQGTMSVVTAADPTGRYVAGRSYPTGGSDHPLLIWDNGQARTVTMSGTDQQFTDINSAGEAVGTSYTGTGTAAWVYRAGKLTRLAGGNASATGINDRGVISGTVDDKPAMWRSASAQPTVLALPGADRIGNAAGIDEDGTIVGSVQSSLSQPRTGYEWLPDGTGRALPVPTTDGKPVTGFFASAIRAGWVIGGSAAGGRESPMDVHAARWNLRTGDLSVTADHGLNESVNAQGWIAGDSVTRAALKAGGKQLTLPDLGNHAAPDNIATTISDDGTTLAGQAEDSNGQPVAVQWRCH